MPTEKYWAHTPPDDDPEKPQLIQEPQLMRTHIENVAALAVDFATPFGAAELARWAAWLHDVGKYSQAFQDYLKECDRAKKEKRSAPKAGSADHKIAGTRLALETLPPQIKEIIALCVLGHHGGLEETDPENAIGLAEEEPKLLRQLDAATSTALTDYPELLSPMPERDALPSVVVKSPADIEQKIALEMLTRFVFSCLVDADSLDTEQHFSKETAQQRDMPSLRNKVEGWLDTLTQKQEALQKAASAGAVTTKAKAVMRVRREVYQACLDAAARPRGVFSLTVPTGGGKTRSGLAFALAHAFAHLNAPTPITRIIYAAPYTTIIDQTVDVFRSILGPEGILEHHSAIEARLTGRHEDDRDAQAEDAQEQKRRLAAENWNAPLIVTTTVQLLESLFSNRTSRCRKLHHMAGSIIILDEVQTLPPHLLTPLLSGLRALVEQYGVTLLLSTATQPAFDGDTPYLRGLPPITPIIPDPAPHFQDLERVHYRVVSDVWDWARVAQEIDGYSSSSLTVLNTKKDALALIKELEGKGRTLFHLSTLLCGAHRSRVLDQIKTALAAERAGGPPVFIVSTQVVECGVDLDAPRVLRACGPLDRIIQSAGRCNREGKRLPEDSEVIVFRTEANAAPPGNYRTGMDVTDAMVREVHGVLDFHSPRVATDYFARLYGSLGEDGLDKKKVQVDRIRWDFKSVAQKMRLIDDDSVPVLVPYHQENIDDAPMTKQEFDELVEEIRKRASAARFRPSRIMTRDLWQQVQPLTVAVFQTDITRLRNTNLEELVPEQLYLWRGDYTWTGIGDVVNGDISDTASISILMA